jgi:hypothetical protein
MVEADSALFDVPRLHEDRFKTRFGKAGMQPLLLMRRLSHDELPDDARSDTPDAGGLAGPAGASRVRRRRACQAASALATRSSSGRPVGAEQRRITSHQTAGAERAAPLTRPIAGGRQLASGHRGRRTGVTKSPREVSTFLEP